MTRRKKVEPKMASQGRRVIVVFGPPASGVSTILDVLSKASETPNIVMPYLGPDSIPQVEEALNHSGAEVVFLDVEGGVFGPEDVQALNDSRLVHAAGGAVVRVYAADEDCLARAQDRPGYVDVEDLRGWSRAVLPTEERIRAHSIPYFMVANHDLEEAVRVIALRSNLFR